MAYDEHLADRIRAALAPRTDLGERKMFGGLAFMVADKMVVGIVGDDLMVRVGPEAFGAALAAPHARPMDFTGKPMTGFVYVAPAGIRTAASLRKWIARGLGYVETLPPPPRRKPRPRKHVERPRRKPRPLAA